MSEGLKRISGTVNLSSESLIVWPWSAACFLSSGSSLTSGNLTYPRCILTKSGKTYSPAKLLKWRLMVNQIAK